MNPTLQAALRSWPFSPWLLATLVASGGIYGAAARTPAARCPTMDARQLTVFFGGLAAIYLALASPVETFSSFLLAVHMTQHMLLMMVAAPLVARRADVPAAARIAAADSAGGLAPLVQSPAVRVGFTRVTQPVVALGCSPP